MTKPKPPANEPRPVPGERRPDYQRLRRFLLRGGVLAQEDGPAWTSARRDGTHFAESTCRWLSQRKTFTVEGKTYRFAKLKGPAARNLWHVPEIAKAKAQAHKAEQERFLTG